MPFHICLTSRLRTKFEHGLKVHIQWARKYTYMEVKRFTRFAKRSLEKQCSHCARNITTFFVSPYRDRADCEGEDVGEASDGDRHPGMLQGQPNRLRQG